MKDTMQDMMENVFETEPWDGWDDYGGTHLTIIATSIKEAWREAIRLHGEENIVRICGIFPL